MYVHMYIQYLNGIYIILCVQCCECIVHAEGKMSIHVATMNTQLINMQFFNNVFIFEIYLLFLYYVSIILSRIATRM